MGWFLPFLAGAGAGMGASSLFGRSGGTSGGTSTSTVQYEYTPQQLQALSYLRKLYKGTPPNLPTLQVAPMSEGEQLGYGSLLNWAGGESPGLNELAKTIRGDYLDISKTPWFEPVVKRGTEEMNLSANRAARKLNQMGMLTSGPGETALARIIREGGENMVGTLAPYAMAERTNQLNAIPAETGEVMKRLGALFSLGSLPRSIEDAINAATYQKQYGQTMFPYTVQAPIAQGAASISPYGGTTTTQPYLMQTGGQSTFSQISPLISSLIMAYALGGGGGGGGGNFSNPINTFAANPTAGNAALINDAWLNPASPWY